MGPMPYAICGNHSVVRPPSGEFADRDDVTDDDEIVDRDVIADATRPASRNRPQSASASRRAAVAKSGRFRTIAASASAVVGRAPHACHVAPGRSTRAPHGGVCIEPIERGTRSATVRSASPVIRGEGSARCSASNPSNASAVAVADPPMRRPASISRAIRFTARSSAGRTVFNSLESRGPSTRTASPSAHILRAAQ